MSTTTTRTTTRARTAARHVSRTHRTLKTAVPVITSTVTLIGAIAMALEAFTGGKTTTHKTRSTHKVTDVDGETADEVEDDEDDDEEEDVTPVRYSFLGHVITLLHHLLTASTLLVFIGLVAYLTLVGGPTVTAVVLTVLVMAVLWLSSVAARQAA